LKNIVTLQRTRLNGKSISIRLDLSEESPHVAGDHDRLVQLFTNLLQNAVDATIDNGDICIRVLAKNTAIIVEVLDSGTGLAPQLQGRLFEPFLTTKSYGMGLGLSICREIAEAHKARLSLENRTDQQGVRAEVIFSAISPAGSLAASVAASVTS
jgi:signal transduction histidine kinase